jgi:hypothetical protein
VGQGEEKRRKTETVNISKLEFLGEQLVDDNDTEPGKTNSPKIYLAKNGINRQVTLKGRYAEVFSGFCPFPLM